MNTQKSSKSKGSFGNFLPNKPTVPNKHTKHACLFVYSFFRELEVNVSQPQAAIPLPLGHSLYLNTDPTTESVALYNSLITGYKWWDKAHDYAGGAASLWSQNSLNRSHGKVTKTRRRPTNTTHTAPPQ